MTRQGDNNPGTLELVRVLESVELEGFRIEAAFLEFSDSQGRSCQVYAERCLVDREDSPALVHCPGGGQTVNRADLLDWARKGFSCASFDWQIGDFPEHDPARKSRWPDGVVGQNQFIEYERDAILPLAVRAAGVCIDWLLDSGRVNPDAIGVTGISWGGYLTWLIAAYEPRVKAAVPVYGCGGHFDDRHPGTRNLGPEIAQFWKENWDPFYIADRQTKPICYLSCTNDFFGILPLADELLNRLNVPHRRGWLPNCNHSISPAESALGLAWFRWFLDGGRAVPEEPVLQDDLTIQADAPEEVALSELWWTPDLQRGDLGCWIKGTPDRPAAAVYGRVHYKSGLALSTPLISHVQARSHAQSQAQAHTTLPYGLGWHWGMGSTQFHSNRVFLKPVSENILRLTADPDMAGDTRSFFLNQFADPSWNSGEPKQIRLGLRTEPPAKLREVTITLFLWGTGKVREVSATLPVEGDAVTIRLDAFPDAHPNPTWKSVVRVMFQAKTTANSFLIGPIEKQ